MRINKTTEGYKNNLRQNLAIDFINPLLEQLLNAFKNILVNLSYLGAHRSPPHSLFRPATTDPVELGISGEFAAQMLHLKRNEIVHFLPMPQFSPDGTEILLNHEVKAMALKDAINHVMKDLSIQAPLAIKEIMDVGFQVLFGKANLVHAGRGLSHLLPVVALGLFADPLRFTGEVGSQPLEDYNAECNSFSHLIFEEPESHIHPKVASRLAHYFVSLAMSQRQLLIETHSDHLVRRLRGLAARAKPGSDLETWLLKNVVILNVSQDDEGCSSVQESRLNREGGIEDHWPEEFMDESSDEESAIFYAKLDKTESSDQDESKV